MSDKINVVKIGSLPTKIGVDKYKNNIIAVSLADGTIGEIISRAGQTWLHGYDGSKTIGASDVDENGDRTTDMYITGSLTVKGDFVIDWSRFFITGMGNGGVLYVDENGAVKSSLVDEVETEEESTTDYEYLLTFVKSHNLVANSGALFTDEGMFYNPKKKTLTVTKQIISASLFNDTELSVSTNGVLDIYAPTIRINKLSNSDGSLLIGCNTTFDKSVKVYDNNSTLRDLAEVITSFDSHVKSSDTHFSTLDSDISSLKTNLSSLSSTVNSVSSKCNTNTSNVSSLTSSYNTLKSNYDTLQSNYNTLKSNYDTLQSNYDSLKSTVATLVDDFANGTTALPTSGSSSYTISSGGVATYRAVADGTYTITINSTRGGVAITVIETDGNTSSISMISSSQNIDLSSGDKVQIKCNGQATSYSISKE